MGDGMSEMDFNALNAQVIEEFRTNGGKVGGMFEGAPLVLLHHVGRKSGKERVSPLMSRTEGDRVFIFASKAGAPDNPDWFHNIKASPDVSYEFGTETISAKAVVLEEQERDRVYADQARDVPQFGEYQEQTERKIPVVELVRS
jgi:deazaflavin-dependent oxidoreductase (nitroreductase family)